MTTNNQELHHYLGFSHFEGIGPTRFMLLVRRFGSVAKAYGAGEQELGQIIGTNLAQKFVRFRGNFDTRAKLAELEKKKIAVVPLSSSLYPHSLKNISDPPICLYMKGNISLLNKKNPFFAIVGTRTPTRYGKAITGRFTRELAQAGFVIVSGMAIGVDSIAHWATLDENGYTIAVLGCGVDVIYPGVNRQLYYKIIEKDGVVLSEFPPGRFMEKGLFIARNRIISGLSRGILVAEGDGDSGSLITARFAAEQGKEVFALPGPVDSAMSVAPNLLIKNGARLVTGSADIFEELGIRVKPSKIEKTELQLDEKEKEVFRLLDAELLILDDISFKTGKTIGETLETISAMEIKGIIEKTRDGKYQIRG